jgi:hypothetical protein
MRNVIAGFQPQPSPSPLSSRHPASHHAGTILPEWAAFKLIGEVSRSFVVAFLRMSVYICHHCQHMELKTELAK